MTDEAQMRMGALGGDLWEELDGEEQQEELAKAQAYVEALEKMHPGVKSIMSFFEFDHLPSQLAGVSAVFFVLARHLIVEFGQSGPELVAGLRKLLEAKDCMVRHAVEINKKAVAGD